MGIIISGLLVVLLCVFPVMITARKFGAGKCDLVDCIIAIIVATFATSIVLPFLPGASTSEFLSYFYSFLLAGFAYKYVLQANYITSVFISLISTVISSIAIYVLAEILT